MKNEWIQTVKLEKCPSFPIKQIESEILEK